MAKDKESLKFYSFCLLWLMEEMLKLILISIHVSNFSQPVYDCLRLGFYVSFALQLI